MNQNMHSAPEPLRYADDEIDLLDLIKVVWRSRLLIVASAVLAVLAALLFTMTRERTYESRAVFILERPSGVSASQSAATSTAALASVLRSRVLAEAVVDELELTLRWQGASRSQALRRLQDNLSVEVNDRDGIVTVKFSDPNPVLARDVIEAFIVRFQVVVSQLLGDDAIRAMADAETRMLAAQSDLQASEAALQRFTEEYGIVNLQQQTSLLVEAHAALTEQIRALTVELSGKQTYLSESDAEVQDLLARIAELERQRQALEVGEVSETLGIKFGLNDAPALAIELERLQREVRVQRELYERLRQQYEAARIEASATLDVARVIDPPQVPDAPVSRRLALSVALAGFLGVFVGVMSAFVLEFFRQRAQDDEAVRELPFLSRFRERTS